MGLTGLEPVTLRLSSACSNQLSYRPRFILLRSKFKLKFKIFKVMEVTGLEPVTSCLQSRCSTN